MAFSEAACIEVGLSESEAMFRHRRNSRSSFDTDVKHKPDMDVRGSKQ